MNPIKITLQKETNTNLAQFTFEDFLDGRAQSFALAINSSCTCKVHPMHKGWMVLDKLWPNCTMKKEDINLANNDLVKVYGWSIEFDPKIPKDEAHFC